jgi:hypothetical protein
VPLTREPDRCWILLVASACTGELHERHWPAEDPASKPAIENIRWHLFAHDPTRNPPEAELWDQPCLTVTCRCCGRQVGDGEHFADAEHAWEAAEQDHWQGDVCPFCQPAYHV